MTPPETVPYQRRWRRWLVALTIIAAVGVGLLSRDQLLYARAQGLALEIQSKGGQVYADTTLFELVQRWWAG